MYLSQELEAQHIAEVKVQDGGSNNGSAAMKFGGGEKFLKNPPRIPEPKEYTRPIPKVIL